MKAKVATPPKLPLAHLDWTGLIDLIGKAHAALARYGAALDQVRHPIKTLSLLLLQESLLSSCSPQMKMSLPIQLSFECLKKGPAKHVNHAEKISDHYHTLKSALSQKSITLALFRKVQKGIYKHTSAPKQDIGRFRNRQNWIGKEGCPIEEAYFYPPKAEQVSRYMSDMMRYLQCKDKDPLVQLAIFFAQFLIIHPFMNGNGRVARVLIPLFLHKKGLLSAPLFFLSAYFRRHRSLYMLCLYNISAHNDWEGWIRFFLNGIVEQGEKEAKKIRKIHNLHEKIYLKLLTVNAKKADKATEILFENPLFTLANFAKKMQLSERKAQAMLTTLQMEKLLKVKKLKKKEALEVERLLKIVGN